MCQVTRKEIIKEFGDAKETAASWLWLLNCIDVVRSLRRRCKGVVTLAAHMYRSVAREIVRIDIAEVHHSGDCILDS